jgi:hypothetical protein
MALVDTTIVVNASNIIVTTEEAPSLSVSTVNNEIVVFGAPGFRGPMGPMGPSGLEEEIETDFSLIYRLST